MAICTLCDQEMTEAASCSVEVLHQNGTPFELFPHGKDPGSRGARGRCPDCGVARVGYHHVGCDVQRCPSCRRQLISCDCRWDELRDEYVDDEYVVDDDEDLEHVVVPILRGRASLAPCAPPAPTPTPFEAVAAPLRVRHRDAIRSLATWSLERGRPCDLDVAAACLDALERHRDAEGYRLGRPTVTNVLVSEVHNIAGAARTMLPEDWHTVLWSVLTWLHEVGRLHARSDPLDVLREPLRCYGLLDADGHAMPEGSDVDFACQCFVPYDSSLPPGVGRAIVGHDPEDGRQFLARAALRPRSRPTMLEDFQPLFAFARRLRSDMWVAVHPEAFSYVGRVLAERRSPELRLYQHDPTARRGFDPLALDADATPWRAMPDRRHKVGYRWVETPDRIAATRAGAGAINSADEAR